MNTSVKKWSRASVASLLAAGFMAGVSGVGPCGGHDLVGRPGRRRERTGVDRPVLRRQADPRRAGRRLRRQLVAAHHPRRVRGRGGEVRQHQRDHLRRRPEQPAEDHLRPPGPGRPGRRGDRRLPRRRSGHAAGHPPGLQGRHLDRRLHRLAGRHAGRGLCRLHRAEHAERRRELGAVDRRPARRQGQGGVPRRHAGQPAEPGRARGHPEGVRQLPRHRAARRPSDRHQLGSGRDPEGGGRPAHPVSRDRRHHLRLRRRLGRRHPRLPDRGSAAGGRGRPTTPTSSPACGWTTRTPTRTTRS